MAPKLAAALDRLTYPLIDRFDISFKCINSPVNKELKGLTLANAHLDVSPILTHVPNSSRHISRHL